MKKVLSLIPVLIFFASCSNGPKASEKYPGYYETDDGTVFAIHSLGESGRKPMEGDWIEVKMANAFGDSTFYDTELLFPSGTEIIPFSSNKHFSVFAEGDSGTVLLPARDLGYGGKDSMMLMNVKLVKIYSEAEHTALEKNPPKKDDELLEQQFIRRWVRKKKYNATADANGLYVLTEKAGSGETAASGDTVLVQYDGMLFNGGYFDEFEKHPDGVEYVLGTPDQMLRGFELAVRKMKQGGKMRVLVPSAQAWGSEGSTGGVIKPYSPVIFNIELLKVKKKKTSV